MDRELKGNITHSFNFVNRFQKIPESVVGQEFDKCKTEYETNFSGLFEKIEKIKNIKNKEQLLLEFRRFIEMLLRTNIILCTRNVYDSKITVISPENYIFYIDRKYYEPFQMTSFMEIFRIETSDFKQLFWNSGETLPHLGLILNYVLSRYNTTYRFFKNRNAEYHKIYTILYKYNKEIRELVEILNSYHYMIDQRNVELYNMSYREIKKKAIPLLENIKEFLTKI